MPATPAWPPQSAPRLFIDQPLALDATITLSGPQAHYLLNVMRISEGDAIKLFDNVSGEYLATVAARGKRDLALNVAGHLRAREEVPDFWACVAPIKRQRFDMMAEKLCELGVKRLVPVKTARAVVDKIKPERMMAHMIEAAEQCERTALPELGDLVSLDKLLDLWPADRHLFFADERLHETGNGSFRKALRENPGPGAILIGPEGGFSDAENAAINACPQSIPISLGPRILRADTAALAATALWMAGRGDWD